MSARRFQATEQTTYRDLQATMRRLGATSLRVPRDLLDAKAKKAEIVFDRNGRRYTVACDKWSTWLDNFRAAERTIYFLYSALDNYGATTSQKGFDETFTQFFSGFEALPDDTVLALGSGEESWWDVLGVSDHATKAEVISAYRALARVHHPDVGGQVEMFKRLRRAYEQAMEARGVPS